MLDDALSQQRLKPSAVYECEDGLSIQALGGSGARHRGYHGPSPLRRLSNADSEPTTAQEARGGVGQTSVLAAARCMSHGSPVTYAVELIREPWLSASGTFWTWPRRNSAPSKCRPVISSKYAL
jgi:hypothetical protein